MEILKEILRETLKFSIGLKHYLYIINRQYLRIKKSKNCLATIN